MAQETLAHCYSLLQDSKAKTSRQAKSVLPESDGRCSLFDLRAQVEVCFVQCRKLVPKHDEFFVRTLFSSDPDLEDGI